MRLSFRRGDAGTVAVEFSGTEVRLAAWAADRDGPRLLARESVPISAPEDAESAVRDFLVRFRPAPSRFVWSLPRSWATVRVLSSAPDPAQATEQALGGLPFARAELAWDAKRIGGLAPWTVVAVVRKDALSPFAAVFRRIGRWPDTFALSCFSLTPEEGLRIHRHEGWVELNVGSGGRLLSTRAVPLADPSSAARRIAEECRATLRLLPEEAAVPRPVLCSGLAEEERAALETELGLPVKIREGEARWETILGAAGIPAESLLNLWPEEEKSERRSREFLKGSQNLAVRAAVWTALLLAFAGWKAERKWRELSGLRDRIARVETEGLRASRILERSDRARARQDGAWAPLEAIRELAQDLPPDIRLSAWSYDSAGRFSVQGRARRLSEVTDLAARLGRSPWFARAELAGSRVRSGPGETAVDFDIRGSGPERSSHENESPLD